jgi:DtxR family Mn-dependent transcriptional regulator
VADVFLIFLNQRGLHLGLKLKIKRVVKFDGSMEASYSKRSAEVLSHTVCERLLVERV